jgi:hypothetical protein
VSRNKTTEIRRRLPVYRRLNFRRITRARDSYDESWFNGVVSRHWKEHTRQP